MRLNERFLLMPFYGMIWSCSFSKKITLISSTKTELLQEGILFRTQFPSLGILSIKKLDFEKTRATQYLYNF